MSIYIYILVYGLLVEILYSTYYSFDKFYLKSSREPLFVKSDMKPRSLCNSYCDKIVMIRRFMRNYEPNEKELMVEKLLPLELQEKQIKSITSQQRIGVTVGPYLFCRRIRIHIAKKKNSVITKLSRFK